MFDHSGILWFTMQNAEPHRTSRSQDRRDQAADAADARRAPLWHGVEFEGRRCSSTSSASTRSAASIPTRCRFSEYPLPDPGCPPAPHHDHQRRRRLVHRFRARLSRPARSRDRQGDASGRRRAGRSPSPMASRRSTDVIWYSESGSTPNTVVRFDPEERKIPELGDPGRRQHRAQHLGHAPTAISLLANSLVNGITLVTLEK